MSARVLVSGVGNIFLGDDGFGVAVARRLNETALPPGVSVVDFGIRGVHLAYQLLDGYDTLILIDAIDRGATPGTLFVMEPDLDGLHSGGFLDAHGMDPASVLGMLHCLGGHVDHVLVVGCQPAELGEGIGLSAPVQGAVDGAVHLLRDVIERQLNRAADHHAMQPRREMRP